MPLLKCLMVWAFREWLQMIISANGNMSGICGFTEFRKVVVFGIAHMPTGQHLMLYEFKAGMKTLNGLFCLYCLYQQSSTGKYKAYKCKKEVFNLHLFICLTYRVNHLAFISKEKSKRLSKVRQSYLTLMDASYMLFTARR